MLCRPGTTKVEAGVVYECIDGRWVKLSSVFAPSRREAARWEEREAPAPEVEAEG
jgi:hypothetical protein